MENTNTNGAGIKPGVVLTVLGAVALAGLTALLAWYNAAGWFSRQLPTLAYIAIATEAIAFFMAVCAELAWGRGGHLVVRVLRVTCCLIILAGCESFNAAGSHFAWGDTMVERAETLTKPQRDALAADEARLTTAIADAERNIKAVPRPDLSGGPLNDVQALEAWKALTASDRDAKAAAELAQRNLDRKIEQPAEPFPAGVVWGFLSFLGFVKVAGLWAIGMAFFRSGEAKVEPDETNGESIGNGGGTIVALPTGEARKKAVRALKAAGLSYGEIERRYGVRKGTAHRWCN